MYQPTFQQQAGFVISVHAVIMQQVLSFPKAAVKYNLYSSEDEFDCGLSSPKKAASDDDDCFFPEANSAIDSEADSPPPKAPKPKWVYDEQYSLTGFFL